MICDLQYAYDRNGNRTAKSGTMILPDHSKGLYAQFRDIRYRYDRMDRLTAEVSRYIRRNGLAGLEYQGKLYGVHRDEG